MLHSAKGPCSNTTLWPLCQRTKPHGSEYELDSFFINEKTELLLPVPVPWLQGERQPLKTVLRGKTATRPDYGSGTGTRLQRRMGPALSHGRRGHSIRGTKPPYLMTPRRQKAPVEHYHCHSRCLFNRTTHPRLYHSKAPRVHQTPSPGLRPRVSRRTSDSSPPQAKQSAKAFEGSSDHQRTFAQGPLPPTGVYAMSSSTLGLTGAFAALILSSTAASILIWL